MTAAEAQGPAELETHEKASLGVLALGALGVVFGDIGTSPLYAVRECFHGMHAAPLTRDNVIGVLSLVFWSLTIIVSIKYISYLFRANQKGEGGVLTLTNLASALVTRRRLVLLLGVFGTALLYGDGMITPAISVLSAVEGLEIIRPGLEHMVVPVSVGILVALFWFQRHGTAKVGATFGPVILVWFLALAAMGIWWIVERPEVLEAVIPTHAISYLARNGTRGFMSLGAVVLVVTGAEALYADLGHFGARPIRVAWFSLVLPSLVLNYFGQGALLLQEGAAVVENPFFRMVPRWGLEPLVVLSTLATVIASQALISGVFSVTRQAIMLGFLPRMRILHTSSKEIGQIYVPFANWGLMLAAVYLVVWFKTSSALASAYGVAVTLTMAITTALAYPVARHAWGWSFALCAGVTTCFFVVDGTFVAANLARVLDGGWFPLAIGGVVLTIMTTWQRGRQILAARFLERTVPMEDFFELIRVEQPHIVPGVAVYMTGQPKGAPTALLQNMMHNRVVHRRCILLSVVTEELARVPPERRFAQESLGEGFDRVVARYGFMETPNVPLLLDRLTDFHPQHATYFMGRETLVPSQHPGMAIWREHLFAVMSRNALSATAFFGIPPDQVVEMGVVVEI